MLITRVETTGKLLSQARGPTVYNSENDLVHGAEVYAGTLIPVELKLIQNDLSF